MNINRFQARKYQEQAGDDGDQGGTGGGNWREMLAEDLRNADGLKPIKDVNHLANEMLSLQRMMGNSIRMPGEDASEEQVKAFREKLAKVPGVVQLPADDDADGWKDYYRKMGMPETADNYKLKAPEKLPEGFQRDEATETWLKNAAHAAGLSNKQAQAIYDSYLDGAINTFESGKQASDTALNNLKAEWGQAYDQRMGAAKAYIKKFADEGDIAALEAGIGNDPAIARTLANAAMQTLEAEVIKAGGSDIKRTPAEIDLEIAEISENPAYFDKNDPRHNALVQKRLALVEEKMALQDSAA